MNILVLSGVFHPEAGGPPTYLYHLLPELQRLGHVVRVVAYGEDNSQDYGYPVERISRRQGGARRLWALVQAITKLSGWADVLFVQGYVLPLLMIRWRFKRVVVKIVSDSSWEIAQRRGWTNLGVNEYQSAALPLQARLLRTLYRRAVRTADVVIAPSQHVAGLIRGWGVKPERVHVIYNGIPLKSDLSRLDPMELRRELGLPEDRYLLVSVGRLEPVKGVDVAIRALAHLSNDVELVVVGDGSQRAELQTLAGETSGRVRFVGRQSQEAVQRFMRAADVFVLSSHTEGLPHVALEALAVGTPVVATAVGGSPEVLTDGVNGLLVPANDATVLAAGVKRLQDEPKLARRLAENGLVRSHDFAWETTVEQTEALLRKMAID